MRRWARLMRCRRRLRVTGIDFSPGPRPRRPTSPAQQSEADRDRTAAGPSLLARILFEKFGQHQPLNGQAERYAREGVPLRLSTLGADRAGEDIGARMPPGLLAETAP
jgi:transposase